MCDAQVREWFGGLGRSLVSFDFRASQSTILQFLGNQCPICNQLDLPTLHIVNAYSYTVILVHRDLFEGRSVGTLCELPN